MTNSFLKETVRYPVLPSTSDVARELVLEERASLPLLVRADLQTCGRGRGRNSWWSDNGSLTFTLALDPVAHGLSRDHEPRVALATAVAIVDALAPFVSPVNPLGIRWPNDIEVGRRKLGGILPERIETQAGPRLLIGIGLNLQTRLEDAPKELRPLAVSLAELSRAEKPLDMEEMLASVLDQFPLVLARLASDDQTLAARWAELDTLLDQHISIKIGPSTSIGVGQGIDREGALRLAAGGAILRFFGGQVLRTEA
ncbi:MAG: hypothetical protein NVSMB9_31560 [Isosphaeraceae bacterium]